MSAAPRRRALVALVTMAAVLFAAAVAQGNEGDEGDERDAISFRLGLSFSFLDRPADQPGDVTLLAGSAFTGAGFVVGATYELARLAPILSVETGFFYGHSTATGFEIRGEQEREVLLEVDTLRLPLWVKGEFSLVGPVRGVVGFGPEAVIGFASASTVRERNIPEDQAAVLQTEAVTSLHLTGILGIELDAGPVVIPLSFHASVNPLTGGTTAERVGGVEGKVLGPFRVEFDVELIGMLGVAIEL